MSMINENDRKALRAARNLFRSLALHEDADALDAVLLDNNSIGGVADLLAESSDRVLRNLAQLIELEQRERAK